jgi:transcriptional regulator of NAD metabolism
MFMESTRSHIPGSYRSYIAKSCAASSLSLFVRVAEADRYRKLLTALHNFQRTICNVTHFFLEENRR